MSCAFLLDLRGAAKDDTRMLIAQITDLHIGFGGDPALCKNTQRLEGVLEELESQQRKADLVLITGDLIETGEEWAYAQLKKSLSTLSMPYYCLLGNHDNREAFGQVFPSAVFSGGFLQYTIEDWPVRIIMLDTLQPGKHGGGFCEARAAWLAERLAEQPDRPTLIALHHPPIDTGIGWMTTSDTAPWVMRLRDTITPYKNIVRIICGHIHRSIFTHFEHVPLTVSLAVAPQVKLNLAEIDPHTPDNRILLTDSPAAYGLHEWNGKTLTTHTGRIPDGKPVIRFDEKHAFVVKHTMDMPK